MCRFSGSHIDSRTVGRSALPTARIFALIALALVVLCWGCSSSAPSYHKRSKAKGQPKPYKVRGRWYTPLPHARDFRQRGTASWYGSDFHGKKTSNGERYNMYDMTAAHKTLPLGTWVRVRNLDNNRQIEVRVNDRGPFVRGRVIDLSYTAAKKLGVLGPGTAPVEIVAIGVETTQATASASAAPAKPVDFFSGNFTFQVGAFKNRANAQAMLAQLDQRYQFAHIVPYDNGVDILYRVRVGRCHDLDTANRYESILIDHGFSEVFVVAE
jgi:rare lipoprotein A